MNDQLKLLRELEALLTEYTDSLSAAIATGQSPAAMAELQKVYARRSEIATGILIVLQQDGGWESSSARINSNPQADALMREFRGVIRQSGQHPLRGVDDVLGNFDRLYTILGPNKFPDDD